MASIRESKSDDKKFSIYTGTKRVHLRAETREDRVKWMEALQAVKEMFPRISNSDYFVPMDNEVAVSTEKLRQRLLDEGVTEDAIQESEDIMRDEFSALHKHLVVLKQRQLLLIDTLRQLEVLCLSHGIQTNKQTNKSTALFATDFPFPFHIFYILKFAFLVIFTGLVQVEWLIFSWTIHCSFTQLRLLCLFS